MEKDTIILSVDKYNELRDFKLAIEKGNILKGYSYYNEYKFIAELEPSEAILLLKKENESANNVIKEKVERINKLQEKIRILENPIEQKEITIADIKKMGYFEFKKWKNK